MLYDPNEGTFPPIGEPVQIEIMRAEEAVSASGRDMMILHTTVCPGQPGGGFESKFYALSFHLGDILRACGMDASAKREIDPLSLRGCTPVVTFKQEPYVNASGEPKKSTKIDQWLPASGPAPMPKPHSPAPAVDIDEDGTVREEPPDEDYPPF